MLPFNFYLGLMNSIQHRHNIANRYRAVPLQKKKIKKRSDENKPKIGKILQINEGAIQKYYK